MDIYDSIETQVRRIKETRELAEKLDFILSEQHRHVIACCSIFDSNFIWKCKLLNCWSLKDYWQGIRKVGKWNGLWTKFSARNFLNCKVDSNCGNNRKGHTSIGVDKKANDLLMLSNVWPSNDNLRFLFGPDYVFQPEQNCLINELDQYLDTTLQLFHGLGHYCYLSVYYPNTWEHLVRGP